MTVRSTWLVATGQSREDTRLTMLGATTPADSVNVNSGILPGSSGGQSSISGFAMSGTSAMVATVNQGRCVIQSNKPTQGAYPVSLPDSVSLTFTAGDAQYPRIDLVVVRVYDDQYDSSGLTQADVEIVQGTPAATPVAPSAPLTSLPLYQVYVPSGASAGNTGIAWGTAVTDVRSSTVAVGGIHPVYGNLGAAGSYPGQYRDNNGILERWDGTAWGQYPPVPTWQNWTPTWTTTTGLHTPSFGNAGLNCRYIQMGPVVHLRFSITFGSTTNFGSGATSTDDWLFSLPVPAASPLDRVGFAELNMTSLAGIRVYDTNHMVLLIETQRLDGVANTNNGWLDSVSPWIWASNLSLYGVATYEAA